MKRLFILSVDSLFYEDTQEWLKDCPHFLELFRRSAWVQKVTSVYPAMTYAAHATMLTGCYPEKHGIYHNEKVQIDNPFPEWHWRREELKVPTFIDAAKSAGYRFAVINWPVTGADPNIDYNVPEIWSDRPDGDSRPRFLTVCSEGIDRLYDKYRHLLRWKYQPELDEFGLRCLLEIMEQHQPEVVLLHLSYLDHARHANGGFSPEAKFALQECDRRFGEIVELLKRQGLYEQTNFAVFGDHGHLPVKQVFCPNIIFRENGLIELDENGLVKDWKAYCHSAGLSCHVVLKDPADEETRKKVVSLLEKMVANEEYGCEQIFSREELLEQHHLSGPFEYVIEGRPGTSFGNNTTGPLLRSTDNRDYKLSVSAHGHLPEKGPQPTFFAAGPDFQPGVVLPRGLLIDEAPTYARLLGVSMPQAQGKPMDALFRSK